MRRLLATAALAAATTAPLLAGAPAQADHYSTDRLDAYLHTRHCPTDAQGATQGWTRERFVIKNGTERTQRVSWTVTGRVSTTGGPIHEGTRRLAPGDRMALTYDHIKRIRVEVVKGSLLNPKRLLARRTLQPLADCDVTAARVR